MQMTELPPEERWFQRAMTAGLVVLAAGLVGLGWLFYA